MPLQELIAGGGTPHSRRTMGSIARCAGVQAAVSCHRNAGTDIPHDFRVVDPDWKRLPAESHLERFRLVQGGSRRPAIALVRASARAPIGNRRGAHR